MARSTDGAGTGVARLLAFFAVLAQIVLGASVLPPPTSASTEAAVGGVICHASDPAEERSGSRPGTPDRHPLDCAFCPLCQSVAHAGVVLPETPAVPPRTSMLPIHPAPAPPARAPPIRLVEARYPRGPPPLPA